MYNVYADSSYDTPKEEIELCLNCPKPACDNCCTSRHRGRPDGRRTYIDPSTFRELYNTGVNQERMAAALHVARRSVTAFGRRYHIPMPPNPKDRPKLRPGFMEEVAVRGETA